MFFDTSPTPYDVRFDLFGVPIRIHPSFWLFALIFVSDLLKIGVFAAAIGIAVSLVSLLSHELAHSLMFRRYGISSSIVLYSFGGYAMPTHSPAYYTQRIAVSLAGPFANFLIFGLVWASNQLEHWSMLSIHTIIAYSLLVNVNLFLGIVNLLPIWPLDGGRVSRELWARSSPRDGVLASLRLSFATVLLVILYSLNNLYKFLPEAVGLFFGLSLGMIGVIFFAMIAIENYQAMQALSGKSYYDDGRPPWRR